MATPGCAARRPRRIAQSAVPGWQAGEPSSSWLVPEPRRGRNDEERDRQCQGGKPAKHRLHDYDHNRGAPAALKRTTGTATATSRQSIDFMRSGYTVPRRRRTGRSATPGWRAGEREPSRFSPFLDATASTIGARGRRDRGAIRASTGVTCLDIGQAPHLRCPPMPIAKTKRALDLAATIGVEVASGAPAATEPTTG